MSRVYILLLNWNNWPDTLECLESLTHLNYPDYRIVICDNHSRDDSIEKIKSWASGNLEVIPESCTLWKLAFPSEKPLKLQVFDEFRYLKNDCMDNDEALTLICNQKNYGFAGGYNVGLRYALSKGDADYFWLLNNDTVVDEYALTALVGRIKEKPDTGICGSTVLRYHAPEIIDALGGAYYSKWLGLAWHLGRGRQFVPPIDPEQIEKRMDYVVGSSMLVSRRFLQDIGLMNETYFLYYEEIDWATRGKGSFALGYASKSLVYHKIGGTIGTSSHPIRKSLVSDFYTLRNRLIFTRQHFPCALPSIYFGMICAMIVRLLCGQWQKAMMIGRLMLNNNLQLDRADVL